MFFSQDWRERIKTENPEAGFGRSFISCCQACVQSHILRNQAKSVNSSAPSGKKWTKRKRRWVFPAWTNVSIGTHHAYIQPYVEQATADKTRAEKEKASYDVCSLDFFPSLAILTHDFQSGKKSASGDDEEEDEE